MLFPGDPEFTLENYGELPYHYPIIAVKEGLLLRRETLNDMERPTAMVTAMLANQNRDPKKNKKPFSYEDFCFYKPMDDENTPAYVYGSSMLAALNMGLLPSWALFCFKEVTASASREYVPAVPLLFAEDAILLHPKRVEGGWYGMLIAQESASNRRVTFSDPDGKLFHLQVPTVHTKVICQEESVLFD